ncbi:GerMN domain-containing protein [Alkaliphilus serpentinus]|uniref:GerMN domain-containing protein n=1 Tax=Alkaliphilus serpentinus TaxID=1482731 RepID=UPI0018657481|nr:GerMN domain-containing protein [Alkaliphilus serpentinus]
MKKNLFIILMLLVIILLLFIRCVDNRYINNNLQNSDIEIAPFPEGTLEEYVIYFANSNREHLVKEIRTIERMNESREEIIMRELMKGPIDSSLRATIPPRVRMYSITTADGITYVNFSKEFVTKFSGEEMQEATTIYSIVNSLTELSHVNKVNILVEGERLDVYNKLMSLKEAYSRNEKIIMGSFMSPAEVIKQYFNYIANKDYRRAYDLLYRPLDINIDYSMYYHLLRTSKGDVIDYTIRYYSVNQVNGTITMLVDYEEITEDETRYYKNGKFKLKNEFGEWKILLDEIEVGEIQE